MIKKCVICGREFEAYDKPKKTTHGIVKRPSICITCSKKCSRELDTKRKSKGYKNET